MKWIKIGLLLTMLSFLLIACGGAEAPAPAAEPETQAEAPAAEEEAVVEEEPAAEEEMAEEEMAEEEVAEEAAAEEAMAEDEAMAEMENITIGMMKIVSHPALDAIQAGFLETLAEGGYVEGENLTIIDGNAEGDIATLTTIAQQFVDEGVDLIATTSTPALQAAYNVTKDMEEPIPIIFNAVTSPYAAGVANSPDDHPAWVLGTQIFPPIDATFEVMQEAFPDAQVIGYLYNPAEANSVAQYEEAQPIAEELGYTMEIGTISNSSEVKTAAEALVARGIDFFYYSQDSTMASGAEGLIQVANENAIPIITNDMPGVGRGVAIGVGLDFSEDGIMSGQYAVDFLNGDLDLATAPILRVETTEYHYNTAAAELQGIELPQSLIDIGIDQTPAAEEAMAEDEAMAEKRDVTIGMMKIVSHPALESIQAGFLDTMAQGGYVQGENLTVIDGNAEGDIATLTTIAQQFVDEGVDMIVATSTPALQAAYNVTKDMEEPIPIIFNAVTSPYAAGVANSPEDHPAWVLGSQIFPPIRTTFEVMQEVFPGATVIGYMYNPAEANSVAQYEEAQPIADEMGYTMEIATVSNSSEVKTAAEALVARGIDFFYYSQDSTMGAGLEGLVQVANENVIPIITNDMPGVGRGDAVGVGLDFTDDGIFSGQYAVDFLDGNLDLATAPILRVETTAIHYNTAAAELQGLELPQSLIDKGIDMTP